MGPVSIFMYQFDRTSVLSDVESLFVCPNLSVCFRMCNRFIRKTLISLYFHYQQQPDVNIFWTNKKDHKEKLKISIGPPTDTQTYRHET